MHALHVVSGTHLDDAGGVAGGLQQVVGGFLLQRDLTCSFSISVSNRRHTTSTPGVRLQLRVDSCNIYGL